jgi:glyoxylase-like metal-dependent hydrolase (beta-lactamase superfamily II)
MPPQNPLPTLSTTAPAAPTKLPTEILPNIFAFPPNRDTLGGTAYLIVEPTGNILIDAPAWHEINQEFFTTLGGVRWLAITHRGGIGQGVKIAQALGCEVIIQEQEAYLLPELKVRTFQNDYNISETTQIIWTPGHSPGSSCIYYSNSDGVLFSGRHLLPDSTSAAVPLRTPKTFHWPRQLRSVALIWQKFPPTRLRYLCPGANTGLLRGNRYITLQSARSV